jgi:hypothetical protein
VHGDKYDYSLVKYTHNKLKVEIVCKMHGVFPQQARLHLKGQGCRKCYEESQVGWTSKERMMAKQRGIKLLLEVLALKVTLALGMCAITLVLIAL